MHLEGIDGKSRTHWFSSQLTFNQIAICVGSSRQCFQWGYSKRDLSDNRLSGKYPLRQLSNAKHALQLFSIARNNFFWDYQGRRLSKQEKTAENVN